jgi:Domain of unknown function (DUF4402)
MKKSFMLAAAAFLAFAGVANAQNSATTTGHASARVITPISIDEDMTLAFGGFFAGTGGTVTITPTGTSGATGTRAASGGVTLYTGSQAGTWHQNEFSIEGEVGFTYTTTITSNTFNLTGPGTPMSCTMNSPVVNNVGGPGSITVVGSDVGGFDNDDVFRGGVLTVANGQASGSYAGTFTYAVAYN